MPTFSYKAMDSSGQAMTGSVPANSRAAALDILSQKGLIPVAVDEVHSAVAVAKPRMAPGGRVPQSASEAFVRELSNLLAGGVPLSKALHILSRETSHAATKRQWTAIHDDVVGGQTLAEAMGKWPRSFSPVQTAMVRA